MARKKRSKKVAARQAQLSQRKKRGRGPSGIPTMTAAQRRRQPMAAPLASTAESEAGGVQSAPAQVMAAETGQATAAIIGARQPLVYSFVGRELRRILALSSLIIAAIVILSIFLD